MKASWSLAVLLSLPALGAEIPGRPLLEGVDLAPRDEDLRVSILIEAGAVPAALFLLDLGRPREVSLRLMHGPAEFLVVEPGDAVVRRLKEVHFTGSKVVVPPILVGSDTRGSTLTISIDGEPLATTLFVGPLGKGTFERYWTTMRTAQPAILLLDLEARYGVIDPAKFALDELPADAEMLERRKREEEGSPPEADPLVPEAEPSGIDDGGSWERCPALVWLRPRPTDDFPINDCNLNLRPYAKIEFTNEPDPMRAGFSVKLESVDDGSLVWASGPFMIGIDGLYRTSWGCGVALKVPNNTILTVDRISSSCCRGPLAAIRGVQCEWLATLAHANWADCPL